jgi:nucleotide-binding universal stress UspA family protein
VPCLTGSHLAPVAAFHNVVCALDLSPEGRGALAWAAAFAREFAASLRIVHAISMSTVRAGGIYFDADWRAHVAHQARQHIAELQHDLGLTAEAKIEVGEIPEAVVTSALAMAADLVVIGRGPKSYSILREAPCPVVVVN